MQQNKVALITGASRGVGEEIAYSLARSQYDLILLSRSLPNMEKIATRCKKFNVNVELVECDLLEDQNLQDAHVKIMNAFGYVDVLINNAGLGISGEFEGIVAPIDSIEKCLSTNLSSLIKLTALLLPSIKSSKNGAIINIASRAGKYIRADLPTYTASKFGVVGFTLALFEQLRKFNIKVSVICPGPINTSMILNKSIPS